jgi:hypothetical protein
VLGQTAAIEGEGAGWLQRVGVANGPISHLTRDLPGAPQGRPPEKPARTPLPGGKIESIGL